MGSWQFTETVELGIAACVPALCSLCCLHYFVTQDSSPWYTSKLKKPTWALQINHLLGALICTAGVIGVSSWTVWREAGPISQQFIAQLLHFLCLVDLLLWPWLLLKQRKLDAAAVDAVGLVVLATFTVCHASLETGAVTATLCMTPVFIWGVYTTMLSYSATLRNANARRDRMESLSGAALTCAVNGIAPSPAYSMQLESRQASSAAQIALSHIVSVSAMAKSPSHASLVDRRESRAGTRMTSDEPTLASIIISEENGYLDVKARPS